MLRFALSALVVAGVIVTAPPVFADPVAATASDHVQAAAPTKKQPTPPTHTTSSSSDAALPATAGFGKNIIPVGFGWG